MAEEISILLVEDSMIPQLAAKMLLQKYGCKVDVASTGAEALEKAQTKKYDIILMDIGLEEGTDGFLVTLQIRKNTINKETKVIILSAHSHDDFISKMAETGIDQFISKPLLEDQVIDMINNVKQ